MIGTDDQPRNSRMKSTPLPSGSPRSRTTRSGLRVPASISPCFIVSASTMCQPSPSIAVRTKRRICRSSSTSSAVGVARSWSGERAARTTRHFRCPRSGGVAGGVAERKGEQKRAPRRRGSFSAQILPRCASTIARLIASPSPTPGVADSRSPRVNFSKIASSCLSAVPGPWSLTRTSRSRPAPPRPADQSAGRCVLSCIFEQVVRARARSASRRTRPAAGPARAGLDAAMRRAPSRRLERAPTTSSNGCHSRRSFTSPLWIRAMSSRLLTIALIRCASTTIACADLELLPRQRRLGSGNDSASPTRAASGVRRSCESADSSELRSRSDSIRNSACCATST